MMPARRSRRMSESRDTSYQGGGSEDGGWRMERAPNITLNKILLVSALALGAFLGCGSGAERPASRRVRPRDRPKTPRTRSRRTSPEPRRPASMSLRSARTSGPPDGRLPCLARRPPGHHLRAREREREEDGCRVIGVLLRGAGHTGPHPRVQLGGSPRLQRGGNPSRDEGREAPVGDGARGLRAQRWSERQR
jgi:hypothetical protein